MIYTAGTEVTCVNAGQMAILTVMKHKQNVHAVGMIFAAVSGRGNTQVAAGGHSSSSQSGQRMRYNFRPRAPAENDLTHVKTLYSDISSKEALRAVSVDF